MGKKSCWKQVQQKGSRSKKLITDVLADGFYRGERIEGSGRCAFYNDCFYCNYVAVSGKRSLLLRLLLHQTPDHVSIKGHVHHHGRPGSDGIVICNGVNNSPMGHNSFFF